VVAAVVSSAEAWPLVVVVGPTASGKSALALWLAEQIGGSAGGTAGLSTALRSGRDDNAVGEPVEIVSCDSVAVYRGMDIGSAKPTVEERARVPHHGLDLYWPDEACTAGEYARAARAALAEIRGRGAVPIVAGGTGLYLRALLDGLAPAPQRDEALRTRLRESAARRGAGWLHRVLQRLDARAAAAIHANDEPKLIRSIEVTLSARKPQTAQWEAGRAPLEGFRVLQLGVGGGADLRTKLYERINARGAAIFERGLVEETAGLRERYGDGCRALGALGYAQARAELRGELTRAEAVAAAQQGHRQYAKRQLTWFRRDAGIRWLGGFGEEVGVREQALGMVQQHLANTLSS
jgi:tRNA dimethylallyltransferase